MKSVADDKADAYVQALARKHDRPYKPSRTPWVIGLILTLAFHGFLLLRVILQPPALDPDSPPNLPLLSADAELRYLDGTLGNPEDITFPRAPRVAPLANDPKPIEAETSDSGTDAVADQTSIEPLGKDAEENGPSASDAAP